MILPRERHSHLGNSGSFYGMTTDDLRRLHGTHGTDSRSAGAVPNKTRRLSEYQRYQRQPSGETAAKPYRDTPLVQSLIPATTKTVSGRSFSFFLSSARAHLTHRFHAFHASHWGPGGQAARSRQQASDYKEAQKEYNSPIPATQSTCSSIRSAKLTDFRGDRVSDCFPRHLLSSVPWRHVLATQILV